MANDEKHASHEAPAGGTKETKKSLRGFASMSREKQREIASKGGHAAHAKGTAHEFSADEARAAGRKGGETVSRDRAHMAAIGRAGGHNSHRNRRASSPPSGDASSDTDTTKKEEENRSSTSSHHLSHAHAHAH
jgi:general stress protein YciG